MSTIKTSKNETKTGKTSAANGDRRAPQFVQYRLSNEQLAMARNAAETFSDVAGIISQLVDEGYKFSIAVDKYGGGVQAFITPCGDGTLNWGWTLTARAPGLIEAVALIAWKHYTLFEQVWPKDAAPRAIPNYG